MTHENQDPTLTPSPLGQTPTSRASLSEDLTISVKASGRIPALIVEEKFSAVETFQEAGIDQNIVDAVAKIGWTAPTPVQGMCLPLTVQGRDVAGFAQTGTGKTGVFILTVAQRMLNSTPPERARKDIAIPEVLVLTPTRELTMQIDDDAKRVLEPLGVVSMPVFGGVDIEKQAALLKGGPRMIVATPGRLKDFHQRKLIDLSQVKIFICDEADRMFDMGFIDDVEFFLDKIPEECQKLLFSATTNDNVKELAFEYLNKPAYISVNPEVLTPEKIEQHTVICDSSNKLRVMLGLLREHQPECAIVFANTKMVAEWLHFKLNGNGIEADLITGDLPQSKRIALIQRIKLGQVKALIATDVASRGLHISKVSHVYNFDVPEDPSNYVHRIGRTARAGASGRSYTLVCEDYGENMIAIEAMLGTELAPRAEWFNPEYLSIKDQTGNPFAVGAPLHRNPRDRDDKRKGASGAGFGGSRDRDGKGSPRSADRGVQAKGPRVPHDQRSSERSKGGSGRGEHSDYKSNKHSQNPRHDKNRGPRDHTRSPISVRSSSAGLVPADTASMGLMGWIRKIFRVLFTKKS